MMIPWGGENMGIVPVFYLRLRIENTGKRKAENVQIRVTHIETKQPNGDYEIRHEFPSMNLRWSMRPIQPNSDEYCPFAYVIKPSDRHSAYMKETQALEDKTWEQVDPNKTILSLDVDRLWFKPHLLPVGLHRFHIRLSSDDTKPQRKIIEVNLSGEWYDDEEAMRGSGATVRLIEESSKPKMDL